MTRLGGWWVLLLALALQPAAGGEPVTVFGAASLTDALQECGRRYHELGRGPMPRFSFAASSTLARQIEAGAPADIFASASEEWMDYLAARGLLAGDSRRNLIGNRLVLIAPLDSVIDTVAMEPGSDPSPLLGPHGRLAVGDTQHVPAGIYAEQALRWLGWWPRLARRLALADNVRAALALVARGEAPLGAVYATDAALSAAVRVVGVFPARSHAPIGYPFAMLATGNDAGTRDLFAFLTSDEALTIFERHGFTRR